MAPQQLHEREVAADPRPLEHDGTVEHAGGEAEVVRHAPLPRRRRADDRTRMSTLTLLGIALGLAMDAFAVAIGAGLSSASVTRRQTFRLAFHFGLFQAFMPIIGWLAGLTLVDYIAAFDHWIAFGLLAFIGGKMIYEALKHEEEEATGRPDQGRRLVMLSVATSIDALAVGLRWRCSASTSGTRRW